MSSSVTSSFINLRLRCSFFRRRIFTPSEDAPAAQRAIVLQRLLEQKTQVQKNTEATQSYLTATESALSSVSGALADVRGLAVSVAGNVTSQTERDAAVVQIRRTLEQLVEVGNQQFRGRYLFGGSLTTSPPFDGDGENIVYRGNERHLQSFADLNLLVQSNANGNEVFGTLSNEVRGSVDLNPILTEDTRLADLRGGLGVSDGSLAVSDGATTKTVDISSAETVGDVIRLLESNPPTGRTITARVTSNGLTVAIDAAGRAARLPADLRRLLA